VSIDALTLKQAAAMLRDAVKDQSYRALPLGEDAGAYLRAKRKRLTASSYRDYESILDKFCRFFLDLELADFESPAGTRRLEEFLDAQWGSGAPRTYNKALSVLRDFFKWAVLRGELHGGPDAADRTREGPGGAPRDVQRRRPAPHPRGELGPAGPPRAAAATRLRAP
jgi:hypothetical protein